ncbi:MAG: hypothetical protein ACU85E_05355 [Gammaproteobacteria bacterium]
MLRYLKNGHVRFQIPTQICDVSVADTVTDEISKIEGVYRVHLYRRQKKLSIRFQESVCDFKTLAKQLFQLLADLEKKGALKPKQGATENAFGLWKAKARVNAEDKGASQWFKEKYGEAKETLHAANVITKLGLKKTQALVKDPEKAIIDFLNDILVLYLIKLHWQEITQKWIVKPLKHRYEWMAVFYMFYLLMRSRKAK